MTGRRSRTPSPLPGAARAQLPTALRTLLASTLCGLTAAAPARAESGRLVASGGATALQGSAGGGIVPWAVLSGYGTEDELGSAVGLTRVRTDDSTLACSAPSRARAVT